MMLKDTNRLKFVPQTVEAFPMWNYYPVSDVRPSQLFLRQIENCGRVCWKSEGKQTSESAKPFAFGIIKKRHFSVTEFGTLDVTLPKEKLDAVGGPHCCRFTRIVPDDNKQTITIATSLRELLVWTEQQEPNNVSYRNLFWLVTSGELGEHCSSETLLEWLLDDIDANFESKYMIKPNTAQLMAASKENPTLTVISPIRVLVKCVTSRSVTHELVRHRLFSFLQESQRYCRYKGKLTLIDPVTQYEEFGYSDENLINFFERAAETYDYLLGKGMSPQKARIVLPNQTKTEIYALGFYDYIASWVAAQRCSKHADPAMRRLYCIATQVVEMTLVNHIELGVVASDKQDS